MIKKLTIAIFTLFTLVGCATTSISNAGYKRNDARPEMDRELKELAVIGIDSNVTYDESAIAKSLKEAKPFRIHAKSRILMLQSGSEYPDSEMIESMSKHWEISTLSGNSQSYQEDNLNKLLRYVAASGGNDYVVVYWGVIEAAQKHLQSKLISWIPLVGWSLPDEKTQMRVILKFVVIDVASGQWKTFHPTPIEDEFFSSIANRNGSSQSAEIEIKKAVYANAADELFKNLVKSHTP